MVDTDLYGKWMKKKVSRCCWKMRSESYYGSTIGFDGIESNERLSISGWFWLAPVFVDVYCTERDDRQFMHYCYCDDDGGVVTLITK